MFFSDIQCPTTRTAAVEATRVAPIGTAWGAAPTAAGRPVASEHNLIVPLTLWPPERPEPARPPSLARNAE